VNDPLGTPIPQAKKQLRKKKLKTFSRFLEVEMWKHNELRGLEPVLQAVSEACKQITRIVQRAQTDDIYGAALGSDGNPLDGTNVQGEVQQKLDVLCNTFLLRAFCGSSSNVACVASEEEDEPRCCSDVMVRCCFMSLVLTADFEDT
jgi:fructose-1,6-bisphosphatase